VAFEKKHKTDDTLNAEDISGQHSVELNKLIFFEFFRIYVRLAYRPFHRKSSYFVGLKIRYRVHKSSSLVSVLSLMNCPHRHTFYLGSILILSSHVFLCLPNGIFPSGRQTKFLDAFLITAMHATRPSVSNRLSRLIDMMPYGKVYDTSFGLTVKSIKAPFQLCVMFAHCHLTTTSTVLA
jgi:hypothetical protein